MDDYIPGQPDMKQFRSMYVVVSTLPTVLPLLTFVLWFLLTSPEPSDPASVPALQYVIFAALALASLPLALWVRGSALRKTGDLTTQASRVSAPQTLTGGAAAAGRISMAATAGMAAPEISVLLGFVLGFLTESWTAYLPFAAYTVLGWIIMYPRPAQVRAWYARQMGHDAESAPVLPQPL